MAIAGATGIAGALLVAYSGLHGASAALNLLANAIVPNPGTRPWEQYYLAGKTSSYPLPTVTFYPITEGQSFPIVSAKVYPNLSRSYPILAKKYPINQQTSYPITKPTSYPISSTERYPLLAAQSFPLK